MNINFIDASSIVESSLLAMLQMKLIFGLCKSELSRHCSIFYKIPFILLQSHIQQNWPIETVYRIVFEIIAISLRMAMLL